MGRVGDLSRHLTAYGDFMNKVGNHLGTTVSMYNQASREFRKIDKDVIKITAGEYAIGGEAVSLDKPSDNFDN
jgi:DNA anti-recombination protein RmuC